MKFPPLKILPPGPPAEHSAAITTTATGTPLPTSWTSSTPAWDPSSTTPTFSVLPTWQLPPSALSCSPSLGQELPTTPLQPPSLSRDPTPLPAQTGSGVSQNPACHQLLDERLVNQQLKVIVNGGEFKAKELVVSIEIRDGKPCFRYTKYNATRSFPPAWVSPKHPNPTRDNGLLIIIDEGEHCGKLI